MSEQIEYLELRFVDILGRMKAMIVPCNPANTLDELRKDPILSEGTSVDGSSVVGLSMVEASDIRLVPDPDSLFELPYSMQRTAAARSCRRFWPQSRYHPLFERSPPRRFPQKRHTLRHLFDQ